MGHKGHCKSKGLLIFLSVEKEMQIMNGEREFGIPQNSISS